MKRCKCENRRLRIKWVVVQRRSEQLSSRLKCLACSIKWWSKAKYVSKIPDHVEQSQSGLIDQDILDRILEGTLWVYGEKVYSRSHKGVFELKQIRRKSNGSSYLFVTIRSRSKKKKIALHRLVWMYHHKQLVPDGFDVDHRLGKNVERPNAIENLRLLESSINRSSKGKTDVVEF